jgi:hypothetical protein
MHKTKGSGGTKRRGNETFHPNENKDAEKFKQDTTVAVAEGWNL